MKPEVDMKVMKVRLVVMGKHLTVKMGADAPEAVAPPANPPAPAAPAPAAPAPAAPAQGNPPAPGHGARRRAALPLLDLDALKQDRANLKRQLRECAKNVKAQARRVKFLVLPLSNFFAVFAS